MFFLYSLVFITCCHSPDDISIDRLVARHKSTRDSIISIHCQVEQIASEKASPLTLSGSFWKNVNGYRLKVERPPGSSFQDKKVDSSFLKGHFQQFVTRSRAQGTSNVLLKLNKKSFQDLGNPYFFGLLTFIGPNDLGPYYFEELVANPALKPAKVGVANSKHGEVVVVKLVHGAGYFELQFAEKYNYMVSAVTYNIMNNKIVSYHTVETFVQIAPGIYFPAEVLLRNEIDGKIRETVTTKIKVISVNQLIPDAQLQLVIPYGTICEDLINKQKYQVDAQGLRYGPLLDVQGKPLAAHSTTSKSVSSNNDSDLFPIIRNTQTAYTGQSKSEPFNWYALAAIISIILLIVAALLAVKRRFVVRNSADT